MDRRSELRRTAGWTASALALLLLASSPAGGQTLGFEPVEVEGGPGAFSLAGEDFPGIGAGPAVEVGLRGWLSPRVSVGAGVHHGWHSAPRLASSFRVLSLHLEPRLHLPPPSFASSLRPHVGVRAGYARWTAHEASEGFRAAVTAGGLRAAAVAGAAVPLGAGVDLDLALEGGYVGFSSPRVDAEIEGEAPGSTARPSGSATSGLLMGIRSALRVALP